MERSTVVRYLNNRLKGSSKRVSQDDVNMMVKWCKYKKKTPPPLTTILVAFRIGNGHGGLRFVDLLINHLILDFDIKTETQKMGPIKIMGGDIILKYY